MSRPDRSDAHLPPEVEAEMEQTTREYFEDVAPKRHTKPSRSDYSSVYSDKLKQSNQDPIPEHDKLRHLQEDQQKLVCDGSEVAQEYVETEYYKDLNEVDKQHHTTGTGFIKTEKSIEEGCFALTPDSTACACSHPSSKGNPATNEWTPSADPVIPVSDKPSRSDI
ncbi:uncharacterized protein M6B38_164000 [Iris pallida]|uniref:Uncharacterized protein n=1 Tax=Iris pallida TaxID=29817 RepID=A0AAX6EYJ6_IRIPA|nr:uncharacterized protein M6B38_164000 [Iris pallida]